ncbi:FAD-binding protein [Eggerthellaceae bacterium 3-80]|nr:FAD-binding protein [bacterium D16-34]
MPYAFVCRAHNAQPRHMKWVFWDSKWETDSPAMGMVVCKDFRSPLHNPEQIQQFIEEGAILSAATIDELLAKMEGIDVETAKKSIERYNELCAAGVDEDFGKRKQCLSLLTEPLFYGVHTGATLLVTMGGLKINEDQQVLDVDGHAIKGLWVTGNCSVSFFWRLSHHHLWRQLRPRLHERPPRRTVRRRPRSGGVAFRCDARFHPPLGSKTLKIFFRLSLKQKSLISIDY